jgi:hypothetical protein
MNEKVLNKLFDIKDEDTLAKFVKETKEQEKKSKKKDDKSQGKKKGKKETKKELRVIFKRIR